MSRKLYFIQTGEMNVNTYLTVLLIWNIIVMLTYGTDKIKAKRGSRRISEASLLLITFIFGGLGAMFGMVLFNHKTSKLKFRILVPIAVVAGAALGCLLGKYTYFY